MKHLEILVNSDDEISAVVCMISLNFEIHLLEFIPLGNCFRSYLRQLFIPLFWYQNFVNRKLELFNFAIRGTRWRTARTILETERPVALGF